MTVPVTWVVVVMNFLLRGLCRGAEECKWMQRNKRKKGQLTREEGAAMGTVMGNRCDMR